MVTTGDLSIWEGDGLVEDDEHLTQALEDLGLLPCEVQGIVDACKREAWVHERLAKYEDKEWNLAVARYFWRRTERFREIYKEMEADDTP